MSNTKISQNITHDNVLDLFNLVELEDGELPELPLGFYADLRSVKVYQHNIGGPIILYSDDDVFVVPMHKVTIGELKSNALDLVKCCLNDNQTLERIENDAFCLYNKFPTENESALVGLAIIP